ncbi:MAG: transcription termination factor Rho [Verrucomicrobiota bacterium]|nr:MAG: transcription termination factor Rho [Verrucomicrobiota bacterium]
MEDEILNEEASAPKKRATRKSTLTTEAAPQKRTVRKSRAAKTTTTDEAPAESTLTYEYSDSVRLEAVEDWSPVRSESVSDQSVREVSQPVAESPVSRGDNTMMDTVEEPQYRRFRRLPRPPESLNSENQNRNDHHRSQSSDRGNNPMRNNFRNNEPHNPRQGNENNFRKNPPFNNNRQNNNNRRRPAATIRIGAFSIGYLRGLECMEGRAKLDEFCQTIVDESQEPLDLNEVLAKSNDDLADFASSIDLDEANSRGRIIDSCIASAVEEHRPVAVRGILESMEGGDGIITYACDNYKIRAKSTFVPRCLIQSLGLRRGQTLMAYVHGPQEQSTCPFAIKVTEVLGHPAEEASKFPRFKDLVPYYPTERIFLEQPGASSGDNLSMRVIDLLSPIGFGQRGLIVAPPRTGKTVLLQGIANAIIHNQPKAKLIVLLIDERPEEVTDFSLQVKGAEVISSTFDESAESHVHAAEIVIENARRWVEAGEHVIILLDSITRLARAYNTEQPSSGKVLSGGVEANALQLPKRFFGSARNIEGGGSLTIIATALIETGSRMDDVIFEEFKGTGNMELHLDRSISDKRIFPAINLERSGTRKEELLYHPDELTKVYSLRRAFQGVPPVEAMEMLINRLKKCPTNVEFLMNLNR